MSPNRIPAWLFCLFLGLASVGCHTAVKRSMFGTEQYDTVFVCNGALASYSFRMNAVNALKHGNGFADNVNSDMVRRFFGKEGIGIREAMEQYAADEAARFSGWNAGVVGNLSYGEVIPHLSNRETNIETVIEERSYRGVAGVHFVRTDVTGGMEAACTVLCSNYSLKDGHRLTLDGFFDGEACDVCETFLSLLEKKLPESGLPVNNVYFDEDNLFVTDNYIFRSDAVVFFFNGQDIGIPSPETVSVEIGYDELPFGIRR